MMLQRFMHALLRALQDLLSGAEAPGNASGVRSLGVTLAKLSRSRSIRSQLSRLGKSRDVDLDRPVANPGACEETHKVRR